ncbi:MAG: chemotaxis-specific protein-glutamate methyltransferase CheB [Nitrospirae bacterium]|nr:chemotaxis-specific protein-glutamate methyltransferase CheB [Candidatus Manganitrophaceae bacterium]
MERKSLSRPEVNLLIVDDSPLFRQLVNVVVQRFKNLSVIGLAENGEKAMKSVVENKPDVILLDLEMPHIDGFTFLRWLMVYYPTPVLVISARSDGYSVFRALELGACDFYEKPSGNASLLDDPMELITKIETISSISRESLSKKYAKMAKIQSKDELSKPLSKKKEGVSRILAIGASTGGPPALVEIISNLPKTFPMPVVVSQHMPAGFTKSFSERLNKLSHLPVSEVDGGEPLEPGRVYIAPGGHHLIFEKRGSRIYTCLKKKGDGDRYAPSVDLMMSSASDIFGRGVLGLLLTGMGDDGKVGLSKVKEKGGMTIAESEETAVVFGMPREAIEAGVVDRILPLHKMVAEINRYGRSVPK